MNRRFSRDDLFRNLFGLTASHALLRVRWIFLFSGLAWAILSGLGVLIHFIYADQRSLFVVVMSFVKYLPIMIVPYLTAKSVAAEYLTDIFELQDRVIAEDFIASIALGSRFDDVTVDEGRVLEEGTYSNILLIGGPGAVQVNLDNVAVTEKTNGQPNILYSRTAPWVLEGFERLREIDAVGGISKYAVIDLKDQFIRDLFVASRTKDGIPIEAQDIKIIFSVKRKPARNEGRVDIHSVTDEAVHAIVYKQIVLVGEERPEQLLAGFPWNSTILPLVLGELEELIMHSTLNEILANIGQKEQDQTHEAEKQISTLKNELTGQHRAMPAVVEAPQFKSRSKITARFYEPEFQRKAEALGVQLLWIDIGTWKLPSTIILEKHKEAWNLAMENAAKKAGIRRKKDLARQKELLHLINEVIFSKFERMPQFKELASIKTENLDLKRLLERRPIEIAKDILRAFRKELLAAQSMLNKRETYEKNKEIIEAMQSAIKEITYFTENDDHNK